MEKILLIGAGGHAKTIVDTIERMGTYEIAGFADENNIDSEVYRGYKVLGSDRDCDDLFSRGIKYAFLSIGYMGKTDIRRRLYEKYHRAGFVFPVIVDPEAVVAADARIGEGTYIGRNAVVNADSTVGMNCIINTAAVVEHECSIGDFSHIAVAAAVCGRTQIGCDCMVGANATIIQGIAIGDEVVVGAGSVVLKNIESGSVVVGNPAVLKSLK